MDLWLRADWNLFDCTSKKNYIYITMFFFSIKKLKTPFFTIFFISKLELLVIRGRDLNLNKSFLSKRKYKFCINSSTFNVLFSFIFSSRLLFPAYINELFNFSIDAYFDVIADDTTLICHEEKFDYVNSKCISVLTNTWKWTHAIRFSLNADTSFCNAFHKVNNWNET